MQPPYSINVAADWGPEPKSTAKGEGWIVELWNDSITVGSDYNENAGITSREEYQKMMQALKEAGIAMGWANEL